MHVGSAGRARPEAFLAPLACILAVSAASDAGDGLRFQRISIAQGLSQSTVTCILEDSRGFLWIGSEYGLNRWDGYGFVAFTHDPDDPASLAANKVVSLAEDAEGFIWVGTESAGLDRLDPVSGQFAHIPLGGSGRVPVGAVRALLADADGTLWIGSERGLARRDGGRGAVQACQPAPPATAGGLRVTSLHRRTGGPLWVGTETGLWRLDDPGGVLAPVALGVPAPWVSAIVGGADGTVWVGTRGAGLFRLRGGGAPIRVTPPSLGSADITALCPDDRGGLWIGTSASGLARLDLASGSVRHLPAEPAVAEGLPSHNISALALGRASILWVGTTLTGLVKLDLKGSPFEHFHAAASAPRRLASNAVLSVFEDAAGELWVGLAGGVQRIVRARGISSRFRLGPPSVRASLDRPVYAVFEDRSGFLWLGTWAGGLVRVDPARRRAQVFRHDPADAASLAADTVLAVGEDRAGNLWVGTVGGGLDLFDRRTGRFRHHRAGPSPPALSGNTVRAILEDRSGLLWVGTVDGGVSLRDPVTGGFTWLRHDPENPGSLSNDAVAALYEDRNGTMWVATAGGLNRFDRASRSFRRYRVRDGLPSDAVTGVAEDEAGRLWVAHFKGLSCLDPRTGEITNFDASHGLQSDEFNSAAVATGRDGTLYFGGVNGLTAFRPAEVRRQPLPPKVVITSLRVFDREVLPSLPRAAARHLSLPHTDNFLSFEFVGLDFTAPEKIRYAYRLEGIDRDWIHCGARRHTTYANVPPGRYAFRVKACNHDGVWNETGDVVFLTIRPPWWETPLARLAFAGGAVLLVVGLVRWRTAALHRRLEEQQKVEATIRESRDQLAAAKEELERYSTHLESMVEKRTAQLAEANRELAALARKDPLTGLANRRHFAEFVDAEWRRGTRFGRPLSVIMADIDFFKAYNDRLGHAAGDECLRRIAATLAAHANRPGDLVARWGGEEFVVVLSETPMEIAVQLAERMRAAIQGLGMPHPGSPLGKVTASFGGATCVPAGSQGWEALVEAADGALYEAKRAGRNRVAAAGQDLSVPQPHL